MSMPFPQSRRILLILTCVGTLLCVTFNNNAIAGASDPQEQVKHSIDEVLAILKDPEFSEEAMRDKRIEKIMAVAENKFDFEEMSKRTLAQHWKSLKDDQKKTFVHLFAQLLQKTYAVKIDSYSSEIIYIKGQEIRGNKAVVESVILKNEAEIPVLYRLLYKNGEWQAYDIIIEGVSLIMNYRSQFASIIAKDKFDGLITKMVSKLAQDEKEQ